jgi:general secretion pathway protein J
MTLIEIMVALAILGTVVALLYGAFSTTSRQKIRVEHDLDRDHEIRAGLEHVVRDLSMAYTSVQINPDTSLQPMLTAFIVKPDGNGSRINFNSFSHRRLRRDAHESDQAEIGYFVTRNPDGSGHDVLARREQAPIDNDPEGGGSSQILIDDVSSFSLSVLDPQTLEWTERWDTFQGAMQPNRLPLQVKVTLTVPNPRGNGRDVTYGTRVALPMQFAINHAVYR